MAQQPYIWFSYRDTALLGDAPPSTDPTSHATAAISESQDLPPLTTTTTTTTTADEANTTSSAEPSVTAQAPAGGVVVPEVSAKVVDEFTPEVRRALRLIIYSSLRDAPMRDVLDGILLPPPLALPDLQDDECKRIYTRTEVVEAAKLIPRSLVDRLVCIPLNFGLSTGVYDARLRATMKRLCHLLDSPWEKVLEKEQMLAHVDVSELAAEDAEKQRKAVNKKKNKISAKRIAAMAGVTIVGTAALAITGGLAAPLLVPAFVSVFGAVGTTVGAVGAIGGALLGGGVLATVFIAIVGVASHAATLAIMFAPLLSAANMTAIFGVGGAGLAAYRAKVRLGGLNDFCIRSIDEVEEHPPISFLTEDISDSSFVQVVEESEKLAEQQKSQNSINLPSLGRETKAMNDDLTSSSMKGIVVPVFVRSVALTNIANLFRFRNRRRRNICGIENQLSKELTLNLHATKLCVGIWGMTPPLSVPSGHMGIFLCHNRPHYPTGAGGYVAYRIDVAKTTTNEETGQQTLSTGNPSRYEKGYVGVILWVRTSVSLTGATTLACKLQPASLSGSIPSDPEVAQEEERRRLDFVVAELDDGARENGFIVSLGALEVEATMSPKPHCIVRLIPETGDGKTHRTYFHEKEQEQQIIDTWQKVKKCRRGLQVVIRNCMSGGVGVPKKGHNNNKDNYPQGTLQLASLRVISGRVMEGYSVPTTVPPSHCTIVPFENNSFIPSSAEVEIILSAEAPASSLLSVTAENKKSSDKKEQLDPILYFVHLKAKVSTLNSLSAWANVSEMFPSKSEHSAALLASEDPSGAAITASSDSMLSNKFQTTDASPFARVRAVFDKERNTLVFEVLDPAPINQQLLAEASAPSSTLLSSPYSASNRVSPDAHINERYMSLVVASTGYVDIFDPCIGAKDQQVAIWQHSLRTSALFKDSEKFVAQWDNEEQQRFFGVIGVESDNKAVDLAKKKVVKIAKGEAKTRLMQGAVFAAFHAVDALAGALALPLYVVWASNVIDNSFATLRNRAKLAGRELAAALMTDLRGNRPVTLTGYSFGANVIFECLLVLHEANAKAVVEDVYLFGACVETAPEPWIKVREVVAGRVVNIFNRSDWMLWLFHRGNSLSHRPLAGMCHVSVLGIENVDASAVVQSHGDYAIKLSQVQALVPPVPTVQSVRINTSTSAAAGALVPSSDLLVSADRLLGAMSSPLSKSRCFVLSVTNRLFVVDENQDDTVCPLVFIGDVLYDCTFDFTPPAAVNAGQAGVSGLVTRASGKDEISICGVVGYAMHMGVVSDTILVILSFFTYDSNKKTVCGSCKCVVMPGKETPGEDEDAVALGHRLRKVVDHYGADPSAVLALATGENSCSTIVDVPIEPSKTATAVPDAPFCPLKVAWTYRDTHLTLALSGTLSRDPSHHEFDSGNAVSATTHENLLSRVLFDKPAGDASFVWGEEYLDDSALTQGTVTVLTSEKLQAELEKVQRLLCNPQVSDSCKGDGNRDDAIQERRRACSRSRGFEALAKQDTILLPNASSATDYVTRTLQFENLMAARRKRTVTVMVPFILTNSALVGGNGASLAIVEERDDSSFTTATGVDWLQVPSPEIAAGHSSIGIIVWKVDPYTLLQRETNNMENDVSKCSVCLCALSLLEPSTTSDMTYTVRLVADLEYSDGAPDGSFDATTSAVEGKVHVNTRIECDSTSTDEESNIICGAHDVAASSGTKGLLSALKPKTNDTTNDTMSMRFLSVSITPAQSAENEASSSDAWTFFD